MDRLNALGRGTKLMFIASVLLLVISFFNWQEVEFDLGSLGSGSAGVSAWDDIGGIIMGILTIVLIARIVARMAAVDVPIPVSFAMTSVVLGVLIFIIALLKNLTDNYSTWASYVGVGLAFLVAVGAWLEAEDAGGLESLRSEASSFGSSGDTASAPAAAAATAAAPASTEAPPEAAPAAPSEPAEGASDASPGPDDGTTEGPSDDTADEHQA